MLTAPVAVENPVPRREQALHSVRGLVDVSSPLGARWIRDDACDDDLSVEVLLAQRALLEEITVEWPEAAPERLDVLAGRGRSPSLVWHAQAVGLLLELGLLPTAACVQQHLYVLERRLEPRFAFNPDGRPQKYPWLLRTRHVAWVLACLAEMPRIDVTEETLVGHQIEDALKRHKNVVTTAARYLLGLDDSGPATWLKRDANDDRWTEVWGGDRQANALNTVYAAIGLCRAERHGFLTGLGDARLGSIAQSTALFHRLLVRSVVVEPHLNGPIVRWDQHWNEGWARAGRDLPDGIVGLLALALVEYSSLLREISEPGTEAELRATVASMLARRLGHVLVFRATDNRRRSAYRPHWTQTADAFFSEGAEGEWYVPSYSVCVRAILETGVVPPHHPVVRKAFKTIASFSSRSANGASHATWIDPTRYKAVSDQAEPGIRQHARVDCSLAVPAVDDNGRLIGNNASGLHAAVMAYAALRRAYAREDPRSLIDPPAIDADRRPDSPFRLLEVWREREAKYHVSAIGEGVDVDRYEERTTLSPEAVVFLDVLAKADRPLSKDEIAGAIHARAGMMRHSKDEDGVRGLITKINRQFAASLIEPVDEGGRRRHVMHADLIVRDSEPT